MRGIQKSIINGKFPDFIQNFFQTLYPSGKYPEWAVEALCKVNVKLTSDNGKSIVNSGKSDQYIENVEIKT